MNLPILIIPAYQPGEGLSDLVDELLKHPFSEIIIVNDGSSADKKNIFNLLKTKNRATVLEHAVNLGKGAALKFAFNYVLVNRPESIGCVTVDADGQHLPHDVLRVAEEMKKNPKALVLGSRHFDGSVPLRSQFGNQLTRHIFHFLIGKKLIDTQTGLRGIPATLMRKLLPLRTNRYEFELDMLINAHHSGLKILEVTIKTVYEDGNKSSHFNPLLDSARIYFVFVRFLFASFATYLTDISFFTLGFLSTNHMLGSFILGRCMGLGVSLFGSKLFVFRSSRKISEVAPKFILLWLILLSLSYALMLWLVKLHLNVYIARAIVDCTLFVFNFLVQRDLIFKNTADEEEIPA